MSIQSYKPQINVIVTPTKVHKGQMISIQANVFDLVTHEPMPFDTLYMEILDEKGVPVWPLSTIETDASTISKLISTSDLDAGKTYTVRITPSTYRRPMGEAQFEIKRDLLNTAFLVPGALLIPEILLALPDATKQEKIDSDVLHPQEEILTIAWLVYRTEHDSRVCAICRASEGHQYRPDDPEMPLIPRHPHCRCHYDVISHMEEQEIYQALINYRAQAMHDNAVNAYLAVMAVQNNDRKDDGKRHKKLVEQRSQYFDETARD